MLSDSKFHCGDLLHYTNALGEDVLLHYTNALGEDVLLLILDVVDATDPAYYFYTALSSLKREGTIYHFATGSRREINSVLLSRGTDEQV